MITTICLRGEAGGGGSCSGAEQCTAAHDQPHSTCTCRSHALVSAACGAALSRQQPYRHASALARPASKWWLHSWLPSSS